MRTCLIQLARSRAATALAAASLITTVAHAAEPVTPEQIKAQWVGVTLAGQTAQGGFAQLHLAADGSAWVRAGNMYDTGRWRLSDTGYCTTWRRLRGGEESCFTVQREGERYRIYFADGKLSAELRPQ